MTDVRDQLAALASLAGKEIARLGQVETIDARDELRIRVWPLLAELIDVLQADQEADAAEEGELPATIPVDLVARAVGLVLSMANRLGEHLPKAEMDDYAFAAAEVTQELMALCDPDELAAFIQRERTPQADDNEDELPVETVIDATLVEPEPELGLDAQTAVEEQPESELGAQTSVEEQQS